MTTSPPHAPLPGTPPRPQPAADGLVSAARRNLREIAHGLSHPSHPPVPPLANASKRWRRLLPYAAVLILAAIFVPVTLNVLTNEYGMAEGLAGLLAVAQTAPLLMLAHRPLQAWWIIFPADIVGALVLLQYPEPLMGIWPWPPPTLICYLFVLLAVALRETRRTAISVWALTSVASLVLHLGGTDRSNGTAGLLPAFGVVFMVIGAVIRERGDAQQPARRAGDHQRGRAGAAHAAGGAHQDRP